MAEKIGEFALGMIASVLEAMLPDAPQWVRVALILLFLLVGAIYFWRKRRNVKKPRIIAAPIHYNNPESAGLPRVDDKHRGPGVREAYSLSSCRIDLMKASQNWPMPDSLPPKMVEFAQRYPEDQRRQHLQQMWASDEVTRLISNAMRSGRLPIWIANKEGAEILVAADAILEVDRATIVSGCYRPPNDRGPLYGHPLFVKHSDWEQFIDNVRRQKKVPCKLRKKHKRG